jgi:taurine dioxygenase
VITLRVEPSGAGCGALIRGVDLSRPHSPAEINLIRSAWLQHQVIGICDQYLEISDLERFAAALGPDGDDPFIASIAGHPRVVEVRREADETTPVLAEAWHSDWSFLEHRLQAPCSMARSSHRSAAIRCSPTSTPLTMLCRRR